MRVCVCVCVCVCIIRTTTLVHEGEGGGGRTHSNSFKYNYFTGLFNNQKVKISLLINKNHIKKNESSICFVN